MTRTTVVFGCLCIAATLAACERSAGDSNVRKSDVPAWQGSTGPSGFLADGWKASDRTAWEQQMRSRNQSQNEYARIATP
ncbi:MAG TPA: hypothetical protein VIY30_16660 [Burkholderiaceae bacterium]